MKIGSEIYLLECQSYDDGSMAIRIAEYAFIVARQFAIWDIGHVVIPMPRFSIIYVKKTDKTPKSTTITFTFPDGQRVDYKSANVILAEFTKEYIVEKRLFPYIPFYVARYEKEIAYGGRIEEAVRDLKYFRNEMLRLHKDGELSDDEMIDLMGFVNIIITHITNGNENEERLVNIMGGTVIETESEKLIQRGVKQGIRQGMQQGKVQTIIELGKEEGLLDGVADTPEKREKYLRTINNKANEMDALLNELTLYSKIDTDRIPYNFNKLNVAAYFNDCIEEIGMDLETKHIGLAYFNYVDNEVMIIADPEQLKRVINNIIGNSVKYLGSKQGLINIRIKDVGDFIQVEIEDNGKGIAAKDLPYVFERFYRADASRNSATGGSGIGLSIVKKIIEDHGGKIWATSKESVGTVMYFVIRKYQEVIQDE